MANFRLADNGFQPVYEYSSHVRMGALSVFVLVVAICLAVLAVLSYTTARASLVMAQRQAEAMEQSYAAESAAQDFVAGLDGILSGSGEASVDGSSLSALCSHAEQLGDQAVTAEAARSGDVVRASFTCKNGRVLTVQISLGSGGSYRIDSWTMSTVVNAEPAEGKLFIAG